MKSRRESKYMYGKFYDETFEFRKALHDLFAEFLKQHPLKMEAHNDAIELRNRIVALLNAWIGSKQIETKFGVSIPLDTTPTSIDAFLEKQANSYNNQYKSCDVCGEKRVTHF